MGTTRRLKELNPNIECIAMQPDSPFHGLEGLKYMATAIVPPIYDARLADRHVEQSTEGAYEMAKYLGRYRGPVVGNLRGGRGGGQSQDRRRGSRARAETR